MKVLVAAASAVLILWTATQLLGGEQPGGRVLLGLALLLVAAACFAAGALSARAAIERAGRRLAAALDRLGTGRPFGEIPASEALLREPARALTRAAGAIEGRERESEALFRIGRELARAGSREELLARLSGGLEPAMAVDLASLWRLSPDERQVERVAVHPPGALPIGAPSLRSPGGTSLASCIASRRSIQVHEDAFDPSAVVPPEVGASAGPPARRTIFAVPLPAGERVAGVLSLKARAATGEPARAEFLDRLGLLVADQCERIDRQAQLAARHDETGRALDEKRNLVAMMSHELRTPLHAILGFCDVLLEEEGEAASSREQLEPRLRYLRNIRASGRHVLGLVNDLLDLSRDEAGQLELTPARCPPRSLVREAAATLQPLADQRGIELAVDPEDAPAVPPIFADPVRVRQILDNLIGNAIKFSPEGSRVRVGCASAGGSPRVRLTVEDQGPGIAPEDAPRLFRPFARLATRRDPRSGAGLGLALTRLLAERMGGAVWVESEAGRGARFVVELPIDESGGPLLEVTPDPLPRATADSGGSLERISAEMRGAIESRGARAGADPPSVGPR